MFEESASELRDRLRDAQRNVARLEAENEARLEAGGVARSPLRDRIADLELEKAQLAERTTATTAVKLIGRDAKDARSF